MNILLIGSGGRESALAWKIAQSKQLTQLYIAPGNAGSSQYGIQVSLAETDFDAISKFSLENSITMIVVGSETPLALGIFDYFKANPLLKHIMVIGPSQQAAQLESSKDFAKSFMFRHNIPTASYQTFTPETINQAYEFLETLSPPYVLKADGLAAGKGVVIAENMQEAKETLFSFLLDQQLGSSGSKVIIEEFLSGIECSVFVLTDGKDYLLLPEAKDYKRIGEGDTGLNTGGMGSISPVPFVTSAFMKKITKKVIEPTLKGIKEEKLEYCGFIFFGIIKVDGEPFVIEYNVRMGDPETESVMPRIDSDLVSHLEAAAKRRLSHEKIIINPQSTATVMLVSLGYPGSYRKGELINIDDDYAPESTLFFAGVSENERGEPVTSGGRVIAVTSKGNTLTDAIKKSYITIRSISFEGMRYRKDIGNEFID